MFFFDNLYFSLNLSIFEVIFLFLRAKVPFFGD